MSKVYEINNPLFLSDVFVFKLIRNKTVWALINSSGKIDSTGSCLQKRLHRPDLTIAELLGMSKEASDEHKRVFRTIDGEYWEAVLSRDISNFMANRESMQYYQSVKDCLPPSDGKFYDVMVIMYEDNICGGYKYRLGQYNNGGFHVEHNFYFQKDNFRNSSTMQKIIAWKLLKKCSIEKIREFINKTTKRNKDEEKENCCVHFSEKCDEDCIVHKLATHNTCLSCNALRNSPHLSAEIKSKTDIEIEKMQKEIEEAE